MLPLHTERLRIERFREADAAFLLTLLNDPDFINNIGDREVRDLEAAERFFRDRLESSYREFGFGMFAVRQRQTGEILGMCGLVRRAQLEHVDLGYAFLPTARGQGYALEAARRVMAYAVDDLGLEQLLAIVNEDNLPSRHLLEKLGMRYERRLRLEDSAAEVCLYARERSPRDAGTP